MNWARTWRYKVYLEAILKEHTGGKWVAIKTLKSKPTQPQSSTDGVYLKLEADNVDFRLVSSNEELREVCSSTRYSDVRLCSKLKTYKQLGKVVLRSYGNLSSSN
jgi:hypothetical protein